MNESPDAQTVFAIHTATALGINDAKKFILKSPPLLVSRILESAEKVGRVPGKERTIEVRTAVLTDPIQDDEILGPVVLQILDEESTRALANGGRRLGMCHQIWSNTKRRLFDEHDIEWFSPGEMNPGSCFD